HQLQEHCQYHDQSAAHQVEPQIRHHVSLIKDNNDDLRNNSCNKDRSALNISDKEGQQEYSQDVSVEYGANDIHQLDQVVEQVGHTGYCNGYKPPGEGEPFGSADVMCLRPVFLLVPFIKIYNGGGGKGVEFRGC